MPGNFDIDLVYGGFLRIHASFNLIRVRGEGLGVKIFLHTYLSPIVIVIRGYVYSHYSSDKVP